MSQLILYFIFLVFASIFLLKITNSILKYFNFYSNPTTRGLHDTPITTSGGIYFIFYLILLFFVLDKNLFEKPFIEIFILMIVAIIFGVLDDKNNFRRVYKLLFQIFIGLTFIFLLNFELFENLFPLIKIDFVYLFLNIFFIVAFLNFINFIDGSDGNLILFIFFIIICLITKLFLNFSIEKYIYLIYLFPFLISFYFSNINKNIFLGDSGSIFFSIFLILNLELFIKEGIIFISDILIISSYFVTDMIITFFLRAYHYGFNSFKAHRDHAYQNFCYINKNHKKLSLYMSIYNFIYLFPLYLIYLNEILSFLTTMFFSLIPPILFVIKYSPLIKKNNEKLPEEKL